MGKLIKILGKPIKKFLPIIVVAVAVVGITLFLTVGDGINIFKGLGDKNNDTQNEYTITYHDGNVLQEITVTNGKIFQLPSVPEKIGYTFLGLFDAIEGGNKYVDETGISVNTYSEKQDMRLYMQYAPKTYTLVYDLQGGTANGMELNSSVSYGETILTVEDALIKYDGKSFKGWYTEPNGCGVKITSGATAVNASTFAIEASTTSVTCYAYWEDRIYDVVLHILNDGKYDITENIKVPHGTFINSIRTEILADGNKIVTGWSQSAGGDALNEEYSGTPQHLYSALYQKIVTVTFNSNGGDSLASIKKPYVQNAVISLPDATKNGFRFVGWSYGDKVITNGKLTLSSDDDVTLVAEWADPITITFNTDGGGFVPTIQIYKLGEEITLPTATKTGKRFVAWEKQDGTRISGKLIVNFEDELQLTAIWDEPIVISFNADGGSSVESILVYAVGGTINLPTSTKSAYKFEGWTDEKGQFVGNSLSITSDENKTLKANWSLNVKISFNTDGGNAVSPIYVGQLNISVSLPSASKSGYKFIGWVDSSNIALGSKITISEAKNIEIKATWSKIYSINYVVKYGNSSSNPTSYTEEDSFTLRSPGSNNAYYQFDKWDRNSIAVGTTGNLTITAIYKQTYQDYIYLQTKDDVKKINNNLSGKYMLINDIDLGSNWIPLAQYECERNPGYPTGATFKGELQGEGKTITYSIKISGTDGNKNYYWGLFGALDGAKINNLIVNATITGEESENATASYAGAIAGWINNSTISDCKSKGLIKQDLNASENYGRTGSGGMVGYAKNSTFNNCYNSANTHARGFIAHAAGICARQSGTVFNGCFNSGGLYASHFGLGGSDTHGINVSVGPI